MDLMEQIGRWAGGNNPGLVLVAIIAVIVIRFAVVKAVEQSGARELVTLNAALTKALEDQRETFGQKMAQVQGDITTEVERFKTELQRASDRELAELNAQLASKLDASRNDFAREMAVVHHQLTEQAERFKTELSFEAEKRRQLAARRLDAFDAVYANGLRVIHVLLGVEDSDPPDEDVDARHRTDTLKAFYETLRTSSPLLTPEFEKAVSDVIADYKNAYDAADWHPSGRTPDEMRTLSAVHEQLAAVFRAEQAKRWDDIK